MITFTERMKLIIEYRAWLQNINEKHSYKIVDEPDAFLVFLLSHGLLNEEKIKEFLKSA